MPAADIDGLPPTQYLVMGVLAARARLGEPYWTFPSRLRPTMRAPRWRRTQRNGERDA